MFNFLNIMSLVQWVFYTSLISPTCKLKLKMQLCLIKWGITVKWYLKFYSYMLMSRKTSLLWRVLPRQVLSRLHTGKFSLPCSDLASFICWCVKKNLSSFPRPDWPVQTSNFYNVSSFCLTSALNLLCLL